MNRPLHSVSGFMTFTAKCLLTPVAFSWLVFALVFPKILGLWNPLPIRVITVKRSEYEELLCSTQCCVLAYELIPPPLDLGASAPSYEAYLAQATSAYAFTVNRPELLKKPKPATLKRIAVDFEDFGLKVKEVHVIMSNSTSIRTIVHSLV